ncbi:MAG: hypothetical protein KQH83_05575 [Actinobacteria bacterium]|nr:hypothetical protein [Actinomycetota bacterium]
MKRRLAVHAAFWAAGLLVVRVALVPAEACPPVTAARVEQAIVEAADWLAGGMDAEGQYVYGYDLGADEVSTGYNAARHAGVTMSLVQVYAATGEERFLAAADRGLGYMADRLEQGDGWAAWGRSAADRPTGANALYLAAMALRREATGDPVHDEVMRRVGAFLVGQIEPGGAVSASFDLLAGAPVPGVHGAFATGEAAWALVLLGRVLPGEGWTEAALPVIDYVATARDREEGYISRLPDHWAAYALGDLPPEHLDETRLGLAARLAGYFGMRLRFEAGRTGEGVNLALRWYPGPPAGVGTAGEGIGALHALTATQPSLAGLRANVEERMACTAGIMVERQVTAAQAAALPRPDLAAGAWFYRGYTQMDGQQHVVSALLAALPIVEAREGRG